jgi:hypothetical protein
MTIHTHGRFHGPPPPRIAAHPSWQQQRGWLILVASSSGGGVRRFSAAQASEALAATGGVVSRAADWLLHPENAAAAGARPFPSWTRSILTEISLCPACSCHEIEDGNAPDPVAAVAATPAPHASARKEQVVRPASHAWQA